MYQRPGEMADAYEIDIEARTSTRVDCFRCGNKARRPSSLPPHFHRPEVSCGTTKLWKTMHTWRTPCIRQRQRGLDEPSSKFLKTWNDIHLDARFFPPPFARFILLLSRFSFRTGRCRCKIRRARSSLRSISLSKYFPCSLFSAHVFDKSVREIRLSALFSSYRLWLCLVSRAR